MSEGVFDSLNGLTISVRSDGIHPNGYRVRVTDEFGAPVVDEMGILMPYRGADEALTTALNFLVGYATDRPALSSHLWTLVELVKRNAA